MRIILLFFASLLVAGCWTQKKCARADKHCPATVVTTVDTLYDSIYIEKVITDTVINYDSMMVNDTIVIEKERVKVRLVKQSGGKLGVMAECKDTVIKYVKQIVTVTQERKVGDRKWVKFVLSVAAFVLGWFLRSSSIYRK